MALKDILEDFIKYKDILDDLDRNGTESSSVETYEKQFMKLRDVAYRFKQDGFCTTVEGEKRCNIARNRYKDIVPYDQTRVKLSEPSGDPLSDYINASYIKGVYPGQRYIASQGPMPDTVFDFWKMLWDNEVKIVVMACNEFEGIPRKLRCQRYWATDVKEVLDIGDVSITLVKEQKGNYDEYVIRHLRATRRDETRELTLLHYMEFPDRGIPKCVPSLLDMIELMRELQPANSPDAPPVVIHCSAGCGRTGTIIVIDYIWNMLKCGKVKQDFSIYDVIGEMRKQRMAIVQSLEQFVFVHDAVAVMFSRQLELMQEHSDYYNIAPKKPSSKAQASSVSSEYELIDLHEHSVDRDAKKPNKPDTPPTPTAKPRIHLGSQDAATGSETKPKPRSPRRPSDNPPSVLPKPADRISPQIGNGSFFPADTSTAIYATPFGRPPVVVKKPTAGAEDVGLNEYFEISQTPKLTPAVKSSTGVDMRTCHEYSEVYTSQSMPALSPGSPVYAEIDSQPITPASGKPQTQSAPYEYADPNAVGKWSLQHIARRNPVECEYELPDDVRDEVLMLPDKVTEARYSDSEDQSNVLSLKQPSYQPVDSTGHAALAATAARVKKLFTKPTPDVSSFASKCQPVHVIHRGIDISFPNRVPRPKYGKRPLKPLTAKAFSGISVI